MAGQSGQGALDAAGTPPQQRALGSGLLALTIKGAALLVEAQQGGIQMLGRPAARDRAVTLVLAGAQGGAGGHRRRGGGWGGGRRHRTAKGCKGCQRQERRERPWGGGPPRGQAGRQASGLGGAERKQGGGCSGPGIRADRSRSPGI